MTTTIIALSGAGVCIFIAGFLLGYAKGLAYCASDLEKAVSAECLRLHHRTRYPRAPR